MQLERARDQLEQARDQLEQARDLIDTLRAGPGTPLERLRTWRAGAGKGETPRPTRPRPPSGYTQLEPGPLPTALPDDGPLASRPDEIRMLVPVVDRIDGQGEGVLLVGEMRRGPDADTLDAARWMPREHWLPDAPTRVASRDFRKGYRHVWMLEDYLGNIRRPYLLRLDLARTVPSDLGIDPKELRFRKVPLERVSPELERMPKVEGPPPPGIEPVPPIAERPRPSLPPPVPLFQPPALPGPRLAAVSPWATAALLSDLMGASSAGAGPARGSGPADDRRGGASGRPESREGENGA